MPINKFKKNISAYISSKKVTAQGKNFTYVFCFFSYSQIRCNKTVSSPPATMTATTPHRTTGGVCGLFVLFLTPCFSFLVIHANTTPVTSCNKVAV